MTEHQQMGLRIRTVRESQSLTRECLAEKANISIQFLADIENGKKGMTTTTLKKICTALGIKSDYVVFGGDDIIDTGKLISTLSPQKQLAVAEIIRLITEQLSD